MVTAAGIIALLGTIITFVFAQITRRQNRVDRGLSTITKVEADELDAGLNRVRDSRMQPPTGN